MFDKIDVKGPNAHPLYQYLTENAPRTGAVRWNFEYFLIGPDGLVKNRYATGESGP